MLTVNQAGLPTVIGAIRGTKRTAAQIDEMIGRAQWFYFTRCVKRPKLHLLPMLILTD